MLASIGGGALGMDSSVVPLKSAPGLVLVQTTDFFFPLVDSPFDMGRIAAANVLSDLYAMGVAECDSVLMLLGVCKHLPRDQRNAIGAEMIRGFAHVAEGEARSKITGGQTVLNPWPLVGGVATAVCAEAHVLNPRTAAVVPGDVLVLTKPLGGQVAVNLKLGGLEKHAGAQTTQDVVDAAYAASYADMLRLNRNGALAMRTHGARCATDVTGFGLVGHGQALADNLFAAAVDIVVTTVPCLAGMLAADDALGGKWKLRRGLSAETSGGLLVVLPAARADAFVAEMLATDGQPAWIVGRVEARAGDSNQCRLADLVDYLDVV